jgi:hypothetical protein
MRDWTLMKATPLLLLLAATPATADDAPSNTAVATAATRPVRPIVRLQAEGIEVDLELPAALGGSYQGVRFDRGGMITQVRAAGHTHFGEWKHTRTGKAHDDVTGPGDEFGMERPWGFEEGAPGDTFVKIGVGRLGVPPKKPARKGSTTGPAQDRDAPSPYLFHQKYELVDAGRWTVATEQVDRLEFRHELDAGPDGRRGYMYVKRLRLVAGASPALVIERELTNTGSVPLNTDHYTHNFAQIDGTAVGPDYQIDLNAAAVATEGRKFKALATVTDRTITFPQLIPPDRAAWSPLLPASASPTTTAEAAPAATWPSGTLFTVLNRRTGGRMTVSQDLAPVRVVLYARDLAACVEPFIALHILPGKTARWTTTYGFDAVEPQGDATTGQ